MALLKLWNKLLPEMSAWKLIDLNNEKDVTNTYSFVKSWIITIRAVIYLWERLQKLWFSLFNFEELESRSD